MSKGEVMEAAVEPDERTRARIELISSAMRGEAMALGFDVEHVNRTCTGLQTYDESRDPYSGENAFIATWRDAKGNKLGDILFHADGSFYAEYDVIQPHPRDTRWFVTSIRAWGRDGNVKAEAELLPVIE